jgi:hypothetical protein
MEGTNLETSLGTDDDDMATRFRYDTIAFLANE